MDETTHLQSNYYYQLYRTLIKSLRSERDSPSWATAIAYLVLYSAASFFLEEINLLQGMVAGLIVSFVYFAGSAWKYLTISTTQLRDQLIPELVVRLLVQIKQPYGTRNGLSLYDLRRLKEIAETEQAAADWRGGYINYAVVGFLLLIASIVGFLYRSDVWSILSNPDSNSQPPNNLSLYFSALVLIVIGVSFLWMLIRGVYSFYLYIKEYVSSEIANRLLQIACVEAIALVERSSINIDEELDLNDKIVIANCFGYQILARHQIQRTFLVSWKIKQADGQIYFLLPPKDNSWRQRLKERFWYLTQRTAIRALPQQELPQQQRSRAFIRQKK